MVGRSITHNSVTRKRVTLLCIWHYCELLPAVDWSQLRSQSFFGTHEAMPRPERLATSPFHITYAAFLQESTATEPTQPRTTSQCTHKDGNCTGLQNSLIVQSFAIVS